MTTVYEESGGIQNIMALNLSIGRRNKGEMSPLSKESKFTTEKFGN